MTKLADSAGGFRHPRSNATLQHRYSREAAGLRGMKSFAHVRKTTSNSIKRSGTPCIISDNGLGIPEPIQHRVFGPFLTTKPVGKGTGQGLAISRSIIVDAP